MNRRHFLSRMSTGLAGTALSQLMAEDQVFRQIAHYAPTAKRVIYLFQSGAPSQMDLFDPKPGLEKYRGEDLPASVRMGQRLSAVPA